MAVCTKRRLLSNGRSSLQRHNFNPTTETQPSHWPRRSNMAGGFAVQPITGNNVVVLFDGYSKSLDGETMEANCTCTLIKGVKNVIVDTMTAWDGDRIVEALAKNGLKPSDIHYVVSTHSHTDHIGNNNLFLNAEHIVGCCVQRGTKFYDKRIKQEDYRLFQGVSVTATPGHTHDDVTVLVETGKGKYAVAGDLFEKEEDVANPSLWRNLGTPELEKVQAASRLRIMKYADYVIPGHGPMFKTNESLIGLLESQMIESI